MYNKDSYINPFWSENSGFMTGRDPLGVQNSSITTYSRLLPGMTNLTLRLRYYGFYMWVLDEFFKQQAGNEDFTLREQHNFIRRAELIIAFIMRKNTPNEQSIIGSNFTSDHEYDLVEKGYYDIALGADQFDDTTKGSVYWDYRSGALGQYYAGALSTLKLIGITDKFFSLKEKGKKLSEAFRKSISDTNIEKHFLSCIESGKLTSNDIEVLKGFQINSIPIDSEEWQFYIQLLLDEDGDGIVDSAKVATSMRKDSISLLLIYLSKSNDNYSDRSFILNEYLMNSKAFNNKASLGWYYYYVNEAFHFALETLFWSILVKIDGKPMAVADFINEFTNDIKSEIEQNSEYGYLDSVEDVLISIDAKNMHEALDELEKTVQSYENHIVSFSNAIELIFLIYLEIEGHIEELNNFENLYGIAGQKGRVSENFKEYVQDNLNSTLESFIKHTIKHLMNDHVNTAYRKMGNGESNLLKFVIEDGVISHIQTMPPKHTSPRLRTITNFLHDLSLIDNENIITNKGKEVLAQIIE